MRSCDRRCTVTPDRSAGQQQFHPSLALCSDADPSDLPRVAASPLRHRAHQKGDL